uniref:DUF72 domain-containing protein n=1 Tax=uncultured Acidobacteriota bacterium TaxID=171953 RepID=Q7X339_9BACT|nr:conserved hypothetical protein [uncultured Acidobacteriota bacterium]
MTRFVGTAGWAIPRRWAELAPSDRKGLARYASVLNAVEINSSFYRPHSRDTYARWAANVPESFRFSVKIPKAITHDAKLVDVDETLTRFLEEASGLGRKLGVLLVQLPGRSEFDGDAAKAFFAMLRTKHAGDVVCEPRHPSWFTNGADALLRKYRVARVAADPPKGHTACEPGGWDSLVYFRLHGSPRTYFTPYQQPFLVAIAQRVLEREVPAWVVFDNTGSGAAFENAARMSDLLDLQRR